VFLTTFLLAVAVQAQAPAVLTPAEQNAAFRFAQGLTSSHIRTFTPVAANADDLAGDPWSSVRNFFALHDCIAVRSYSTSRDGDWLVVDVDGNARMRNARHNVRDLDTVWYLRLDRNGAIASAMTEVDYAADQLVRAQDDDARRAIVRRYDTILPKIAKAISDLATRTDRARTRPAVQFLVESDNDPETNAYAWCALARLVRFGQRDSATAVRLAEVARVAAAHIDSCELHAYIEYTAGTVSEPDDVERQRAILDPLIDEVDTLDDPTPALRAINVRAGNQYGIADIGGAYRLVHRLIDLSTAYDWPEGQLLGWHAETLIKEELTEWQNAIVSEKRTAALAHEILNKEFEARSCNMIGESYANQLPPDYERAIPWLRQALQAAPKSLAISAIYHVNLGLALIETGRVREAEPHLQPALENGRGAGFIANAYGFGAHLRRAQGRYQEAMDYARKGIEEGPKSLFLVWQLKADLGQMLIECGDAESGIEALRESIDLIEARRAESTSSAMIRAHYFATRQWVYATLLDVLFERKQYGEALAIAERMKARSLEDSLVDEKVAIELSAAEREREHALNQHLIDLNRELIAAHGAKESESRRKLAPAREELEQFSNEMAMRHAHSIAAHAASDPSDAVASWRGPTVVEYALLPDSIVAFVVRNGHVAGRRLPRTADLETRTNHLLQSIEQRDLEYESDARKLHAALLAPLARLLPKSGSLTIVPDGFLWRVPFDALRTRERTFVAENYSIAYAPSLMMLDRARQRRTGSAAPKELLALGDPDIGTEAATKIASNRGLTLGALPDAGREVRELSNLYGAAHTTVLTGGAATESTLKKLIGNYRIVHLATHGLVDDASPLYSALVLATNAGDPDDGLLEMREMSQLDLHADLVVLSGCDTARGAVYAGEGVIGMSWALLTSGCPTTVVSQWTAPSRSTAKLMIEFHRRLLAGETKANALRHARLALMSDPNYRHPFYWAPFVVVGDGTSRVR